MRLDSQCLRKQIWLWPNFRQEANYIWLFWFVTKTEWFSHFHFNVVCTIIDVCFFSLSNLLLSIFFEGNYRSSISIEYKHKQVTWKKTSTVISFFNEIVLHSLILFSWFYVFIFNTDVVTDLHVINALPSQNLNL